MSQRFDGDFAAFVRSQLDELCTEFINSVPYAMADIIQKKYPELAHSNIMDAISRIARPSDGAEEKSLEWFETSERNISCEFEEEFPDEDEDDDWDESRYYRRNVMFRDEDIAHNLQFCRFDDYIEDSLEDQATFFYGLSPELAVPGYGTDEWVIVE